MDTNEFLHESSFDYDNFFGENTDDYHTMTCLESMNIATNENLTNLNGTSIKNRPTGIL